MQAIPFLLPAYYAYHQVKERFASLKELIPYRSEERENQMAEACKAAPFKSDYRIYETIRGTNTVEKVEGVFSRTVHIAMHRDLYAIDPKAYEFNFLIQRIEAESFYLRNRPGVIGLITGGFVSIALFYYRLSVLRTCIAAVLVGRSSLPVLDAWHVRSSLNKGIKRATDEQLLGGRRFYKACLKANQEKYRKAESLIEDEGIKSLNSPTVMMIAEVTGKGELRFSPLLSYSKSIARIEMELTTREVKVPPLKKNKQVRRLTDMRFAQGLFTRGFLTTRDLSTSTVYAVDASLKGKVTSFKLR